MQKNALVLSYDTEKFPFAKILAAQVFRTKELKDLHKVFKNQPAATGEYEANLSLRNQMQQLPDDALFYKVYHSWIISVLSPHFGNKISYSAHPKMRVHLAGTGSVSSFHRDADITRREMQINCYLPFTDVFEGNTLWVEEEYNSEVYQPVALKYGEALLWDGGFLRHGTIRNDTDNTRVSCDFRFQPKFPELVEKPWSEILSARPPDLVMTEPAAGSASKMY